MRTSYDYLLLSPHLDDAVLSCGGFVRSNMEAGRTSLVVTFFAGDPPEGELPSLARIAHGLWGISENAMIVRRREDVRACREIGADSLHMWLVDCVYRRDARSNAPLYPEQQDVFGGIHPHDVRTTVEEVSRQMALLPPATHVLAPLGLGNHVDHQILRIAIQRSSLGPVSYYEDFPYCIGAKVCGPPQTRSRVYALSDSALRYKIRAILSYESQVRPVFSSDENVRRLVAAHAHSTGGERLWHPVGLGND